MNVMLISLGRAIKKHRLAVIFFSLISSSAVLGILVALQFQPIETVIEQTQPTVAKEVSQSKGQYTISYTTTGPSILSFGKDCDDGKGSLMYYCGIDLQFDGKGGIIDLKIPAALMNEIDPIREVFTSYLLYPTQLPFQRISNDDNYSVFRIEVPANFDEIKMREQSNLPEPGSLIVTSFVAADCIFFGLLIFVIAIIEIIKKIKKSKVTRARFRSAAYY